MLKVVEPNRNLWESAVGFAKEIKNSPTEFDIYASKHLIENIELVSVIGITSIGTNAFQDFTKLENVTISGSVTSIESNLVPGGPH